ncbi:MAG: lysine--tRNA ligase [Anaerolineaceae bacterium]|nr:lysine--tRNA ligase [Anaerolineaceae bacterium]
MEYTDLQKIRLEKIQRLKEKGIDPFPTRANVTHSTGEAIKLFEDAEKESRDADDPIHVTLAGRLRSIRAMGKIVFAHIEDRDGRIQFFLRQNELGSEQLAFFKEDFDLGDFIEAEGNVFRTRTGEVSLHVHSFRMLAKAVTPLPAAKDEVVDGKVVQHSTLGDPEVRYRQRYADLAVNPEVREVFVKRAAIIRALRKFLDDMDFLEVETPILQPIYGGAAAKPFVTHHNQLKQELFLRISFELYLKRLLVGNLERVYEIGRDFRNEGVSYKHNPEFTQLEFYIAYADYEKVMEITENMIAFTAEQVLGTKVITYNGQEIDLTPPWNRVEMRQGIIDTCGIDIKEHTTDESLAAAMQEKGIKFKPGYPRGKLIDVMVGEFLEPSFMQPTFLYDYPRDISPLAKSKPGDPQTVERFEGFVAGMELLNAFTELNDPLDQEARFKEMGLDFETEDEERHPMDLDYLNAMSYGMPPNGGFGMGIDRLTMLLTDRHTIREVLLFPHLREKDE